MHTSSLPKRIVKLIRQTGAAMVCVYCEEQLNDKNVSRDHLIPQCRGGNRIKQKLNVVLACRKCNSIKGNLVSVRELAHVRAHYGFQRKKYAERRRMILERAEQLIHERGLDVYITPIYTPTGQLSLSLA